MQTLAYDDIVWIQTAFIGDIMISTGVCAMLKQKFPQLRQHLITTPVGADALKDCDIFASILAFDKRKQNFWSASSQIRRQLRSIVPDASRTVCLQPHRSFRSSLLARRIGFHTVTFFDTQLKFLATKTIKRDLNLHESKRVTSLLGGIGLDTASFDIQSPWMKPLDKSQASPEMRRTELPQQLIGIAPGSVWGTKKWLNSGFCSLTAQLLKRYPNHSVVLIGGPAEIDDCSKIANSLSTSDQGRLVNLCGRTTLSDMRWLIPRLSLLVSNDSSPVHFASAFNIPTVAIFGATTPELGFGPLARNSRIAQISLNCRPCSAHGPQTCPLGHFDCMKTLSAETVFGACCEILG
jgi:heptosyltransferase-2